MVGQQSNGAINVRAGAFEAINQREGLFFLSGEELFGASPFLGKEAEGFILVVGGNLE